jgi:hypothetical protein
MNSRGRHIDRSVERAVAEVSVAGVPENLKVSVRQRGAEEGKVRGGC